MDEIDKRIWGEYLGLGFPVPIVAIRISGKYSLVSYNWDDWDDFYIDLKEHIIGWNNSYLQEVFSNPPKIIYKKAQLLNFLRESVEFYFFKGHRIYTPPELSIIEIISSTGYDNSLPSAGDIWEFYRKECMLVKFDDLTHYVR